MTRGGVRRSLRAAVLAAAAPVLFACSDPAVLSGADTRGAGAPASRTGPDYDGLTIGNRLMAAGEHELALEAFYAAGLKRGLTAEVLTAIGSANLALGRLNQAEDILRRALDEDDSYVPAWNNLGIALYARGRVGEAYETFRQAFALDSGQSTEIRDNLNFVEARLDAARPQVEAEADFRLVRRGNGRYLLIGAEQ